jgi:GTPase SAR1 family protein
LYEFSNNPVQVYDVTDRASFEAITGQYYDDLEEVEELSVVLIIGNKSKLSYLALTR